MLVCHHYDTTVTVRCDNAREFPPMQYHASDECDSRDSGGHASTVERLSGSRDPTALNSS